MINNMVLLKRTNGMPHILFMSEINQLVSVGDKVVCVDLIWQEKLLKKVK